MFEQIITFETNKDKSAQLADLCAKRTKLVPNVKDIVTFEFICLCGCGETLKQKPFDLIAN